MIPEFKLYPRVKDSGVPRLGEVPEHWELRKLRQILRYRTERNRPDLPLLSVVREQGVIERDTSSADQNHNYIPDDLSNYKVVRVGQFAMNKMKAWQGSYGVSGHDGIVSPAYFVFDLDTVTGPFFNTAVRSQAYVPFFAQASDGVRVGQWDLSEARMREIPFLVPPLHEQAAIVRVLDYVYRRIRRYIRAKRKLIKLLEEQKQAIIHHAVTRGLEPNVRLKSSGVEWLGDVPENWKVVRLRNAAEMRVSNVDKHTRDNEVPVRLCNYVDVYRNDRISADIAFMHASATENEIERFRLHTGDVLITKDSEDWTDIGVPALVEEADTDLICGYHLALLRPFEEHILGGYLFHAFQSPSISHQLHVEASGVTRYGLSHEAIKSTWLPIPTLSEQAAIVDFLDDRTKQVSLIADRAIREISLLREYQTRLIADVVTGKLDVREAAARLSDETAVPEPIGEVEDESDAEYAGAGELGEVPEEVEA